MLGIKKMNCKNRGVVPVIYALFFVLFSCSTVDIKEKVANEAGSDAVFSQEKQDREVREIPSLPEEQQETATASFSVGPTGEKKVRYTKSGSDCKFEKEYVSETMEDKERQNLGRLYTGLWKSERVESLKYFPKDKLGYYPDWVAAVEQNIINPRGTINPNVPEEEEHQSDVLLKVKSPVRNDVCFPHTVHTYWLRCNNCHPEIFIPKKNANPISMTKIIKGEFCGRCHGKVAFHVANNCHRCHNTPKSP